MGKSQRTKGAVAEREFLSKLSELIGQPLDRNFAQASNGGADCIALEGYSIEIKRHEQLSIGSWWKQAQAQAQAVGCIPVLAYRQSRKPWRIQLPLSTLLGSPSHHTVELSLEAFAEVVRDRAPPTP